MPHALAVFVLLGGLSAASAAAQDDWLPPKMQDAVVQQLVERLREIELPWSQDRMSNAARVTVSTIRARLEEWGEPQLLQRAPALSGLELPEAGDERLDAMLRYHMCTAVSFIRHERRAREASEEARIAAVAGITTGTMVLVYLRDRFIKNGGSGEQVEKFLTQPALERTLERLQKDPKDALAAQSECVPVLGAITG